jgi:hypothetical protein
LQGHPAIFPTSSWNVLFRERWYLYSILSRNGLIILYGVAHVLQLLRCRETPIVHRNLDPAYIFLDERKYPAYIFLDG